MRPETDGLVKRIAVNGVAEFLEGSALLNIDRAIRELSMAVLEQQAEINDLREMVWGIISGEKTE